jgi:hypothetical protein
MHGIIIVRFAYIVKRRLILFYAIRMGVLLPPHMAPDWGENSPCQCVNWRFLTVLVHRRALQFLYRRMTTTRPIIALLAGLRFGRRASRTAVDCRGGMSGPGLVW